MSNCIYEPPVLEIHDLTDEDVMNDAVWWAPLAFVLLYWGSAWLWCVAVCWGPGNIKSCDVKWWGSVRAECFE